MPKLPLDKIALKREGAGEYVTADGRFRVFQLQDDPSRTWVVGYGDNASAKDQRLADQTSVCRTKAEATAELERTVNAEAAA